VLISALHDLRQEVPAIDQPTETQSVRTANPAILRLHCYVDFCSILLGSSAATRDEEDRIRIIDSAESMARLCIATRGDGPLKLIQAQLDMVPSLHSACEVLIRDLMEKRAESVENKTEILEEKERLIMSIFDMLFDLIKIFPCMEPVVKNLPELLMGRGEYETI